MSDTATKTGVLQALIEKKRAEEAAGAEQAGETRKRARDPLEDDIEVEAVANDDKDNDNDERRLPDPDAAQSPSWPSPPAEDAPPSQQREKAKQDSDGEGDLEIREEDKDFIDDEGVAEDQRVDFADDGNLQLQAMADEAEEAEDADDLSRLFDKGRRDSIGENQAELSRQAENLMAQMEAALDADREAFDQNQPGLPKGRRLKKAQDAFAIQRLHDHVLRGGVLGVLKGWLEPMPDGSMPNSKVRGGVLQMLVDLKINTYDEEQREWLKKSGVGKLVMLLTKLPEETNENKRVARGLVESWSRPILGEGSALNESQQMRETELMAKARRREAPRGEEPTGNPGKRSAVIPQAAELDYMVRPASKVDASMMNEKGRGTTSRMPKLLKKLAKKK